MIEGSNVIEYMLIAFESTHKAIHFERLLEKSVNIEMIPTPREITVSCGLSIRFPVEEMDKVIEAVENEDLEHVKLFHCVKSNREVRAVQRAWR